MCASFALAPILVAAVVALYDYGVGTGIGLGEVALLVGLVGLVIGTPGLILLYVLLRLVPLRLVRPFGGWAFAAAPVLIVTLLIQMVTPLDEQAGNIAIGTVWALTSATIWLVWQWRRPLRLAATVEAPGVTDPLRS